MGASERMIRESAGHPRGKPAVPTGGGRDVRRPASGCPGKLPITRVNQQIIMKSRLDERSTQLALLSLLGGCVLWSQWPALATMAGRWSHDPRYAPGYF